MCFSKFQGKCAPSTITPPIAFPPAVRSLEEASAIVEASLRKLGSELDKKLPEAASMILEADVMMLHDETFTGQIAKAVGGGASLPEAVARTASDYIAIFEASDNDYMREKARDVEDLAVRLLDALVSANPDAPAASRAASVVVAEKMLPSDVLRVARDGVAGIVLCAGGATAHVSLLVRSLRIPMVVVKSRDLLRLAEGETVILDCANDTVYVHPDAALAEKFRNRAGEEAAEARRLREVKPETRTLDGERVVLEANVNILADLDSAVAAKAEGVGLYRTEFPFLMRPSMPTEADQFSIYSRVLERMGGAPVVFRTLDAGGDKAIPYLYRGQEENPALGLRSIRFSLKYPYILDQQLRAILRAVQKSGNEHVGIMFPMISSVEEFRAAREHVETCLAALQTEIGDKDLLAPAIGAMVEVPAVVGVLDAIAEESDFLSVGTNDLIQYTLAVDRTNAAVAPSYVAHHPAVLKLLRVISTIAARHGTPVSVCGEMGRDPRYMPFLIGIGVRTFSLEPAQIPRCQELVSRCTVPACEAYARDLLSMSTVADIEARIDEFSRATFG
ncbi:MAG: phosphoenolpyruvate--protein phosphotransferase [Kiritimatiellae bacterium]|nr:phosphoenolpyruvate--protein phosphotransferase [Kiritimatiellia bacterium]